MPQSFQPGDKVAWQVGQGRTTGTIQEKITTPKTVDGTAVAASPDDPRYLVKNDHTGNVTAHTADALSPSQSDASGKSSEQSGDRDVIHTFREVVNMTAKTLEQWLQTEESNSVGQVKDGDEAIGHQSGRQIIAILNKKQADYTEDDLQQMKRVVSYVRRHSAQRPSGDIEHSRWRYSLMNWGHDPLQD
jgi:hypothetical protein